MRRILVSGFVLSVLWSTNVSAKIDVLFHPTDPTLRKIGSWLKQAQSTIDISMYDLETSKNSPVIAALLHPKVQERLQAGTLSIRLLYEGYGSSAAKQKKMSDLEALGIDVRYVTSSKKVHHKFAVIDSGGLNSRVITGSANWSMSSYRNYDENILFLEQELNATSQYQTEFERLWANSTEFGMTLSHPARTVAPLDPVSTDVEMHFNSPRHLQKNKSPEHNLTNQIVTLIDAAKTDIFIATTRIRLLPILKALQAASQRGVRIKILLSQDDYHDIDKRAEWLLQQPNIDVRIKFYNLNPSDFLTYQMHNKWMVVDAETLMTGSFNWSPSAENDHIENINVIKGAEARPVIPVFMARFHQLWERGRTGLPDLREDIIEAANQQTLPKCGFLPISLSLGEIRELLSLAPKCQR